MTEIKITETDKKSTDTKKRVKKGVGKKGESLRKELKKYKGELEEIQDKYLRLAAEFDNYKKRTAREFSGLIQNANEELILQLIPILDNFERALDAATSSEDFDSFHKGVEMIYQQLKDTLEKQGVKEIQALGEPFDPHKHEAVMMVEEDEVPSDTVVEEVERGYVLNDKVLRPSKVAVNK